MADLRQSASPAGFTLRRIQSVWRKPGSSLRRSVWTFDHLLAHWLVPDEASRRDWPVDVAEPARLRPGRLAGDRKSAALRRLLRDLTQRSPSLGHHRDDRAVGLSAGR